VRPSLLACFTAIIIVDCIPCPPPPRKRQYYNLSSRRLLPLPPLPQPLASTDTRRPLLLLLLPFCGSFVAGALVQRDSTGDLLCCLSNGHSPNASRHIILFHIILLYCSGWG